MATLWTGFTSDRYGVVLENDNIVRAARNSLIVASSATTVSTLMAIAAVLGMLWIIGRVIYALAYYRDPAKRGLGFIIALLANALLLAAAIWGWGVRAFS